MLPHTSGEWLTSSSWPTEKDSGGNVNNILRVELVDESSQTQEGERVRVEEKEIRGSAGGGGDAGGGSGGGQQCGCGQERSGARNENACFRGQKLMFRVLRERVDEICVSLSLGQCAIATIAPLQQFSVKSTLFEWGAIGLEVLDFTRFTRTKVPQKYKK
jgi:hypothetical protein